LTALSRFRTFQAEAALTIAGINPGTVTLTVFDDRDKLKKNIVRNTNGAGQPDSRETVVVAVGGTDRSAVAVTPGRTVRVAAFTNPASVSWPEIANSGASTTWPTYSLATSVAGLGAITELTTAKGVAFFTFSANAALTGVATLTINCGTSSVSVVISVVNVQVSQVGFTGDHVLTRDNPPGWTGGTRIDDPDGSIAVWTSGGAVTDPVAYTKAIAPTLFARFDVSPAVSTDVTGLRVRARVGTTVIGSADSLVMTGGGLRNAGTTEMAVRNVTGGTAIPSSDRVRILTPTIEWEFSFGDDVWYPAGSSGPFRVFVTEDTPLVTSRRYVMAMERACGFVNGSADIAGALNTGIDATIEYNPTLGSPAAWRDDSRGTVLEAFTAPAGAQCDSLAYLLRYLARTIGVDAEVNYFWGGYTRAGLPPTQELFHFGVEGGAVAWINNSVQAARPAHDRAAASPHFNFHALTLIGGNWFDPSYGLSVGASPVGSFVEFYDPTWRPGGVGGSAILQQGNRAAFDARVVVAADRGFGPEYCPHTQPAQPTGLGATVISESRIDLTWTDNSVIETNYVVQRRTGGGAFVDVATLAASTTAWSSTGLIEATTYEFRVYAFHTDGGGSAFSVSVGATTNPNPPSGLTATANSSTEIALAWSDNSSHEDGYRIERRTEGGAWAEVHTTAPGATSWTNTGLAPSTRYFYRVRAYRGASNSGYSNDADATTHE
jgi:hypothetical protein